MDKLEDTIKYYEYEVNRARRLLHEDETALHDALVEIRCGIGRNLDNGASDEYTAQQVIGCIDKLVHLLFNCERSAARLGERETALMLVKRLVS